MDSAVLHRSLDLRSLPIGDVAHLEGHLVVGRMTAPTLTPRSNAETLLAVQLEQAGIPFEREYRFAPPRRWRADFMLVKAEMSVLLVEIDGGGFIAGRHSRGAGVEADAEKQSAAAILGYRVIRATPRQVEDGRCLEWIQQALAR